VGSYLNVRERKKSFFCFKLKRAEREKTSILPMPAMDGWQGDQIIGGCPFF